ncbi:MAG: hypothetical protein QOI59_4604 [Gammaproteobacteria bacterium]|jgi:hypothetical protein|nr:hypothetical protein [Gammaproteobacteria bacterium]
MTLWNEPSRKEPVSKDTPAAEPTRETERRLAAVPPAATRAVNLTAAVLSFMVVLATGGNTATAQGVSGPADGGSTGIVDSTFASGFTMTTATGIEVTINETSSTKTVGPAGDVRKGTSVLVLGLDNNGTTITADWVVIQPHGDGGAAAAKAHGVIPFEPGVPSPQQSVGTIPASYTQGQGTLVSGIQAFIPVAVAQAVFPGGVVDRVVSLSDGSYEVHNISINWPHHVFVSKDFMYLGAE